MKRFFNFTVLFALIAGIALLATETTANAGVTPKKGTGFTGIKKQTASTNGTSIFGGTLHTTPKVSPIIAKLPPGSLSKYYGNLFGTSNPTQPTKPTKGMGTGRGRGIGFGGSVGGATVATMAAPVATPTADQPAAAPSTNESATDNDDAAALQVASGSTFTIKGESFGNTAGRVAVTVGQILLPVQVTNWSDKAITVTLPQIGVGSAASATFVVERADGSPAGQTKFELVAAK